MLPLTFREAAQAVGSVCNMDGTFDSVSTDSRKITEGCLFIALTGERFDGHEFAANAVEDGASAVIVEKDCGLGDRQIIVENTGHALLDLAGYYRSRFDIPVIGITGSVGKTTTKEMISAVMSSKYDTLKNEGNLNNEIGVPLTLFRLEKHHEAAVIEMGMSGFGEISRMTKAVRPDVAVISNIGVSHIKKLGSREGILKAKLEILEGMKNGSPLILNADNDMLSTVENEYFNIVKYGIDSSDCDYRAENIVSTDSETTFTCKKGNTEVTETLPFTGMHNIYNALAAVSAGACFGIDTAEAMKALRNYRTTGFRQNVVKKAGMTFIEDCYNASPDSQAAAMAVLGNMDSSRKIAVTGDMLELGDYSVTGHRLVGEYAAANGIDILFTYGEKAKDTAARAKELGVPVVRSFTDKGELADELIDTLSQGDAVLFKASRAMKLEDVIYMVYDAIE